MEREPDRAEADRKLFCKNERASVRATLPASGHSIMLVPVAAILVASIRLHFLDIVHCLRTGGARRIGCAKALAKGEEMGWFEHGSTIIMFVPKGFALCAGIAEGAKIRAGQALMQLPVTRAD